MIFTVGVLLCTIAPTSAVFILGRAIAGLGNSGIGGGAVTIFSHILPLQKRPMWFGIVGGVQSITLVSAPVVGGVLIDSASWRGCFGVNLPFCVLAMIFIFFGFEDPARQPSNEQTPFRQKLKLLDPVGTLVIIPCVTCLLLALQWGGTRHGWGSPTTISLLVTFGVLLCTFGFLQYKLGDKATIPVKILKNRNIAGGAWFQACCDGSLALTEFLLSIYFQGVRGFTATKSGALGIPMIVGLMISTILAGVGTSMFGYYTRKYPNVLFCTQTNI